jgi:hypothetical protein
LTSNQSKIIAANATSSLGLANVAVNNLTAASPVISPLPAPFESGTTANTSSIGKWTNPPQSVLDAKKEFNVTDSMIDSLISPSNISEKETSIASPVSSGTGSGTNSASTPNFVPLPVPSTGVTAASIVAKGAATPAAPPAAAAAIAAAPIVPVVLPGGIPPRPASKIQVIPVGGQVRRYLEIPSELIGLVIGHQGRKIKELGVESGSKVQFKTSKTSEKEGKPGILEISGSVESVDKGLNMVWELLQSVGREYKEVSAQTAKNYK